MIEHTGVHVKNIDTAKELYSEVLEMVGTPVSASHRPLNP